MRFLLDQQLPTRLIAVLDRLGHEALHVRLLGLGDATDAEIWAEAQRREAVVVSKDSDFLALAVAGGRLVRVRVGNLPNRDLFEIVERAWPDIVRELESGEKIVELRA